MNTPAHSRRGATLTDLIVAVAVALLLLAVGTTCVYESAKVSGGRVACQNNLHQLAIATLNYEANRRHFPGYANPVQAHANAGVLQNGGYFPLLLPYVERNDIFKEWISGNRPTPYLAFLGCPSDPPPTNSNDELRYVVNAGIADVAGLSNTRIQASGVCFDRTLPIPIQVDMTYLNQYDGASQTLLLTENLDADHWGIDGAQKAKRWNSFVWHRDPVPPTAAFNYRGTRISRSDPSISLARPSSNHGGGVNVIFCDGHYEFVQDDIDYNVYRQLMTSNSKLWP